MMCFGLLFVTGPSAYAGCVIGFVVAWNPFWLPNIDACIGPAAAPRQPCSGVYLCFGWCLRCTICRRDASVGFICVSCCVTECVVAKAQEGHIRYRHAQVVSGSCASMLYTSVHCCHDVVFTLLQSPSECHWPLLPPCSF